MQTRPFAATWPFLNDEDFKMGGNRRHGQYALALGITLLLILSTVRPSPTAASSTSGNPQPVTIGGPVLIYKPTSTVRVVNVGSLLHASVATRSASLPRFLPRDANVYRQARVDQTRQATAPESAPVTELRQAKLSVAASPMPRLTTAFPMINLNQQVSLLGGDQDVWPPDTQVAAGPNYLLELVNASGSIWTKSGSLVGAFNLNLFFGLPFGYSTGDPRVLYDRSTQRWLASSTAFDSSLNGQVYLAISQSSNPLSLWNVYLITSNTQRTLYDQPKLGISGDKVALSWNDYGLSGSVYSGAETWILAKAGLLQGTSVTAGVFGPDATRFNVVPSWSLSVTSTLYLVYNSADPYLGQSQSFPSLGVIAITGDPAQGNLTWTEWDLPMAATTIPPSAAQPGGAPPIETDDDRLLGAVWQNGILWTAATNGCQLTGETQVHSCMRLVQVDTNQSIPRILQSFDAGATNSDVYYPAVTFDGGGNAFFVYNESSSSLYPSVMATIQLADSPANTLGSSISVAQGQTAYNVCGTSCGTGGTSQNRWGDYSGAAPDPSDPTMVWVAGELAADPGNPANWGTSAGELTAGSDTPTPTQSPSPIPTPTSTPNESVIPTRSFLFLPRVINQFTGTGW